MHLKSFSIAVLLALGACNQKQQEDLSTSSDTSVVTLPNEGIADKPADVDDYPCVRGQAKPVLDSLVFPNAIFHAHADSVTGTETLDLPYGDHLTINNWGCEYYVLTFRFETERFQGDTTDLNSWLLNAGTLMNELKPGLNDPVGSITGADTLMQHARAKKPYELGDEIVFGGGDIRSFAILNRVQKINDKRYGIEVTFGLGPL